MLELTQLNQNTQNSLSHLSQSREWNQSRNNHWSFLREGSSPQNITADVKWRNVYLPSQPRPFLAKDWLVEFLKVCSGELVFSHFSKPNNYSGEFAVDADAHCSLICNNFKIIIQYTFLIYTMYRNSQSNVQYQYAQYKTVWLSSI